MRVTLSVASRAIMSKSSRALTFMGAPYLESGKLINGPDKEARVKRSESEGRVWGVRLNGQLRGRAWIGGPASSGLAGQLGLGKKANTIGEYIYPP